MKVLFVCTGNTCRSCMAEFIFNEIVADNRLIAVSAGLSAVPGSTASQNAVELVKQRLQKDIEGRRAIQLTRESITESDLVLTMTKSMKEYLIAVVPEYIDKIFTLKEYIGEEGDIMDPFGGNIKLYADTYDSLEKNILSLINILKIQMKETGEKLEEN